MIIITGVSGAIGSELFKYYYKLSKDTVGTYNNNRPHGFKHGTFRLDISDFEAVISFVDSLKGNLTELCLINGAAITYDAFAHKCDIRKWQEVIDINLTGTFNMIRAVLPLMRDQNCGRIINLSSVVAQKGAIGTSAYSASKSALNGLTRTLALENANKNILVNNINIGYMETGMTEKIPVNIQDEIRNSIPLKRFGPLNDITHAIDFLMKTTYITGTNIDINGGLY